jgi:hypothetical protein
MQSMEITSATKTDWGLVRLTHECPGRRGGAKLRCSGDRRNPERMKTKWRIKRSESAPIFRACAMSRMERNTAEQPVVMQEVKTLRSRVNVIIWHVRSQFGSSLREVPLA